MGGTAGQGFVWGLEQINKGVPPEGATPYPAWDWVPSSPPPPLQVLLVPGASPADNGKLPVEEPHTEEHGDPEGRPSSV